jgi:hypothetical protein
LAKGPARGCQRFYWARKITGAVWDVPCDLFSLPTPKKLSGTSVEMLLANEHGIVVTCTTTIAVLWTEKKQSQDWTGLHWKRGQLGPGPTLSSSSSPPLIPLPSFAAAPQRGEPAFPPSFTSRRLLHLYTFLPKTGAAYTRLLLFLSPFSSIC